MAHQQAVRDWTRITYQAAAYTNTHHAETAPIMAAMAVDKAKALTLALAERKQVAEPKTN